MKIYLFLAFMAVSALGVAQTPPVQPNVTPVPTPPGVILPDPSKDVIGKPITATEAAEIALRNQPNIDFSRAEILAAQGRTQQARSGLVPNASITAGYTRFQNIHNSASGGSSSSATGFTSAITLRQLLFDFNHTVDVVRQASNLETVAKQNLTTAQADLVFQVKLSYYTYTQDVELIKVQESNLTSSQAQLTLAQARLSSGLGAPADVLQAATDVGTASQQLTQARQTALNARVDLALTMGVDPRTPIAIAPGEETVPASDDVSALVASALNDRPEIRAARASIRAAGFGVSAARTTSAPSIGVDLSAGSRGANDPFNSQSGSLGVSLNWDFIDGGFAAGATKIAQATLIQAQADLKQASLNAVNDVSQSYVNLKSAEQRVAIGEAQVANAKESVRLAEGRFKAGVTTFLEVTIAQSALVTAESSLVNGQSLLQQARAQLQRAVGAGVVDRNMLHGKQAIDSAAKKS